MQFQIPECENDVTLNGNYVTTAQSTRLTFIKSEFL